MKKVRQEVDEYVKKGDWSRGSEWCRIRQQAIKIYDNRDDYTEQAEYILDAIDALKDAAAKSVIEPWGR